MNPENETCPHCGSPRSACFRMLLDMPARTWDCYERQITTIQTRLRESEAGAAALRDAAEMLWSVIANVSSGDWSKQSEEWQTAAVSWRDTYFAALSTTSGTAILAELEELRAWKEEITGAIHRSNMGIMRTTQGPSGTRIGFTPEAEKAHYEQTLKVINENISLSAELTAKSHRIAELEGALRAADDMANGRWCEWGGRAEMVRDIIQQALARKEEV